MVNRLMHVVIFATQLFTLAFALLIAPAAVAATASVDRNNIGFDETVTLTITVKGASLFGEPDLDVLEKDFHVLNTQRRTQIINGDATTQWIFPLSPKHTGELRVPSIRVGSEKTAAITITVTKDGAVASGGNRSTTAQRDSLWMTAEIAKPSVYVQEQTIVTIKIGTAIDLLEAPQIDKPDIANTPLEVLNSTQYRKRLNGTLYTVFEIRCALFPGQSGALVIPAIQANVTVPQQVRQNSSSFFQQFFNQGRRVRLQSQPIELHVKEKPAAFPANAQWIVAESLTASETWSDDPQALQTGGSITRTVTLQANGALGEQIPALPGFTLDGFKLYPDQSKTDKQIDTNGINGTRIESMAMLPTRPGDYQIPEIRIPWWNSKTDALEYASVPAISLKVSGAALQAPAAQTQTQPAPSVPNAMPAPAAPTPVTPAPAAAATPTGSPLWMWAAIALGLAWLATLLAWWWKSTRKAQPEPLPEVSVLVQQEKIAWQALMTACKSGNPSTIRSSLLALVPCWYPQQRLSGLLPLHNAGSDALRRQLDALNKTLYTNMPDGAAFDAATLQRELQAMRDRAEKSAPPSALPPLYAT